MPVHRDDVLSHLVAAGRSTPPEIARTLDATVDDVRATLARLTRGGLVASSDDEPSPAYEATDLGRRSAAVGEMVRISQELDLE